MKSSILEMLETITLSLCGLELKITNKTVSQETMTACRIFPFLGYGYINLNELQLESITLDLIARGYDPKYIVLEVLLHEICHWKQYKKFMRKKTLFKTFKYIKDNKKRELYHEEVADRYAHYCLRIIVKDVMKWKNTLNIN